MQKSDRVNAEYKLLTPQKPAQLLDVQLISKQMSTTAEYWHCTGFGTDV